jgi:prepilin-type N-terminal cleavage/methylation domain-containing protein
MMSRWIHRCGRCTANIPDAVRGFSLIEMAVVLFVITLLIGSLLVPLSTQVEQRQISDTQKALDEAREALIGYAVVNGRLPRPAISFVNGAERPANCVTEADCTGFIPWTVLGTARLDAWGKIIRYSVTPAFANSAFTLSTTATKIIQSRSPNSPFAMGPMVTGVPAVIFSHGRNNWGTSNTNTAFPDSSATNVDEDANAGANITFTYRPFSANTGATGGEFDDMIVWLPMTVLANRMVAAGKLP